MPTSCGLTRAQIEEMLGHDWESNLRAVRAVTERQGDCSLSTDYVDEDGFPLGRWFMAQRVAYQGRPWLPRMSDERQGALESLPRWMSWNGENMPPWAVFAEERVPWPVSDREHEQLLVGLEHAQTHHRTWLKGIPPGLRPEPLDRALAWLSEVICRAFECSGTALTASQVALPLQIRLPAEPGQASQVYGWGTFLHDVLWWASVIEAVERRWPLEAVAYAVRVRMTPAQVRAVPAEDVAGLALLGAFAPEGAVSA